MGVKFKCRLSGNVFEFENEYDIKDMREHPQYAEVKDIPEAVLVKKTTKKEVIKKDTK